MSAGPLTRLAAALRDEETPISPHVVEEPDATSAYGSPVTDAVREGYLLHFGEPRLLAGHDGDLAVLAGDYLYALGIERLASERRLCRRARARRADRRLRAASRRGARGRGAGPLARGGCRHRSRVRPQ